MKGQRVNVVNKPQSKESIGQKKFKPHKNHHGYKKKLKRVMAALNPISKKITSFGFVRKMVMQNSIILLMRLDREE